MGINNRNLILIGSTSFLERLLLLLFGFIITSNDLGAQVGINTTSPDSSAVLDIYSTARGVLFPRMTNSERDAIANPALGLIIFNTTSKCVNLYSGIIWVEICGDIPSDYPFIDGIYISPNGHDITGDGSPGNPYATFSKGTSELNIQDKDSLIVAGGTYTDFQLFEDSNHVYLGGFEDAYWTRDIVLYPTNVISTNEFGSFFTVSFSDSVALNGINFSMPLTPNEGSVYGLRFEQSTHISIEDCIIEAGSGANGADGDPGSGGSTSSPGSSSGEGISGGNGGQIGGGDGGDGGFWTDGNNGMAGNGGAPGGLNGSPGGNGGNGDNGSNGTNGSGGVPFGSVGVGYGEADGDDGTNGTNGDGGGGGGGEDVGIGESGDGGGGGGGGGGTGIYGQGGKGGGGSFGLFAYNSVLIIQNCTIESSNGGNGGDGGQGGIGAAGSSGGTNNGFGGDGGNGGNGGNGGHGGGGGGGPSYAVFSSGTSTITLINVVLIHGLPGSGGTGLGNPGSLGVASDKNF